MFYLENALNYDRANYVVDKYKKLCNSNKEDLDEK
jgi:hypothetical protein